MPPSTLVEDEDADEPPKGALETGLWCGLCFLPSAIRWPVVGVNTVTGESHPVGSAILCFDCGTQVDSEGNPVKRHA